MNARPTRSFTSSRGFSLLEVLIASTMFSLGMAGLSTLLLFNLSSAAQSRHSSIASVAAANLAEQIQLNRLAIDRYLNPPESIARICQGSGSGAALCTPQQQADYDYKRWQIELGDQIQHSTAVVCNDSTPNDGDRSNHQCDGSGLTVIKIFWGSPASADNQTPSEHRYTLVTG